MKLLSHLWITYENMSNHIFFNSVPIKTLPLPSFHQILEVLRHIESLPERQEGALQNRYGFFLYIYFTLRHCNAVFFV